MMKKGDSAPAFTLPDDEGGPVTLRSDPDLETVSLFRSKRDELLEMIEALS